jgi:outer membrane lipoprotein-sorting protein
MIKKTCSGVILVCVLASVGFINAKDATAGATSPVQKKFGVKSAVIAMTMEMSSGQNPSGGGAVMASTGTITQTFDEFGAKDSYVTETAMEMMGMKINNKSQIIIKDGFVYAIDWDKKQAVKSRVLKIDDPLKLDFASTNAEFLKKWNIKKQGKEDVAGKSCDIYSFMTDDIQAASGIKGGKDKIAMEGTCRVWNNIGLKAEFIINGSMSIKTTAVKVDENAPIPAGTFDIPAEIKVKEAKE